jgi:ADP-ribosyl-[dinitrogen reductase] hydrolase
MRAAPSAVLLARATEAESVEWAKRLSAVTHGDPATGWGQAIVHVFIRSAVRGDDPWHALKRFLTELPESQELYGRILAEDWTPDVGVITAGGERIDNNGTVWTCLAQAMWAVRSTDSFADAVVRAINLGGDTDTVAAVAGALAGAIHGIAGIPSRWTTYLNGTIDTPKGKDHLRLDDLRRLTQRLLGSNGPARQSDLYPGFGPTEIAPGVHAADLAGASLAPKDWGIVSLCLVDDRFVDHPHRREIYLVDQEPSDGVNPNLGLAGSVRAAVDAVRAFRAEGLEVVVHCYGGASRTGLVLRAYLMSTEGMTDLQAIDHIEQRWPYLGLWSESFTDHLASDWERDTTG